MSNIVNSHVPMRLTLRRAFGDAVKRRREHRGFTPEELAELAAMRSGEVLEIEQLTGDISFRSIYAIATALNLRISALFGDAELEAFRAAGEYPVGVDGYAEAFLRLSVSPAKRSRPFSGR